MTVKLPKIQTVEMLKCDGCGQLHAVEDCEIVVIRAVKGKLCTVDLSKPRVAEPVADEKKVIRVSHQVENEGTPLYEPRVVEFPKNGRPNLIPPGLASMMIDPGQPDFEQNGAKEKRTV